MIMTRVKVSGFPVVKVLKPFPKFQRTRLRFSEKDLDFTNLPDEMKRVIVLLHNNELELQKSQHELQKSQILQRLSPVITLRLNAEGKLNMRGLMGKAISAGLACSLDRSDMNIFCRICVPGLERERPPSLQQAQA